MEDKDRARELVKDGMATLKESEGYLKLCRAKLYGLMDNGDLQYVKMGRSRRIPWRALYEYAAKNLVGR